VAAIPTIIIFGYQIYHTHAQNNSILQITTDKKTYQPGQTVAMTIKNNGNHPLVFSDSLLGLIIQNTKTGQKAGLLGSQVMSELKPNESKTIQWDQKDIDGKQVQPGAYNARTSTPASNYSSSAQPVAAGTTFVIQGNP